MADENKFGAMLGDINFGFKLHIPTPTLPKIDFHLHLFAEPVVYAHPVFVPPPPALPPQNVVYMQEPSGAFVPVCADVATPPAQVFVMNDAGGMACLGAGAEIGISGGVFVAGGGTFGPDYQKVGVCGKEHFDAFTKEHVNVVKDYGVKNAAVMVDLHTKLEAGHVGIEEKIKAHPEAIVSAKAEAFVPKPAVFKPPVVGVTAGAAIVVPEVKPIPTPPKPPETGMQKLKEKFSIHL